MANKAATALVFFVIAIIAFGLSACCAMATYGAFQTSSITGSDNGDTGSVSSDYSVSDGDSNTQSSNNNQDILTNVKDTVKSLLGMDTSNETQYSEDSSISNGY
ncbi:MULTISPECIES: hypothetical protein [Methanobrevibacter]|jgi:archaellum component FlaG (FlaF/FlaG flagellin family)|uniref:hypothetical protein n=1 Tax=Methanobrevibacter TaxID=2172 RepID=UPI00375D6E58|nr:hypothetical protein [Methanobacteriaceae archaeon]